MATGAVMKLSTRAKRALRLDKLCHDIRQSRLGMKPFRDNMKKMIRLDAGADWSENAADLRRPYNGVSMFKQVMRRALINQTPRVMISTWRKEHKRTVNTAQNWANRYFHYIKLGETLDRIFTNALFWMGIGKVGITTPVHAARKGFSTFAGEVFMESIHPDNYVADIFANEPEDDGFRGHRYRGDVKIANEQWKLTGDRKLRGDPSQQYDNDGDERVAMIARGYTPGDDNTFREQTDLVEIWVPQHRCILTFRAQTGGWPASHNDLIEALEYIGPYCGQYTEVCFLPVSGQRFGKGPIVDQIGLDVGVNSMLRKLLRQAERFKQIDLYTGQSTQDAERINAAYDGQQIRVDNINGLKPWASLPPNPQLFGLMLQFKKLHSQVCGNLEVLAGLAATAGTARQEAQLNQNSTAMISLYRDIATKATQKMMEDALWYQWMDPTGIMDDLYKLDSDKNYQAYREVGPEVRRELPWEELQAMVDPYSFLVGSPGQRLRHIRELVQTSIPLMPFFKEQGITLNARHWLKLEGELENNPEVDELFGLTEPIPAESGEDETGKPVSDKTYTHRSESDGAAGGEDEETMINQLMGAGGVGAGDFGSGGGMMKL